MTSSDSGTGRDSMRYSTCFALTTRSFTSSFLFADARQPASRRARTRRVPSKTSGGSNLPSFRVRVTGMCGAVCANVERVVR
jgi:hypothetical protein